MGKLAQIKTKPTATNVMVYIDSLSDVQKREDSKKILEIMEKATGEKPVMWGASMIGFGNLLYKSPATGREVDWFKIGFAPRKANLSLHLTIDVKKHSALLNKLGKHKTGVGCLYIKQLDDIDMAVLQKLIEFAAAK